MAQPRAIHFGYNPPTGNRLIERVEAKSFLRDLQHVCDVASQYFDSLWISDHHMTGDRFRHGTKFLRWRWPYFRDYRRRRARRGL